MFFASPELPTITIGITTFEHRFERYFKPLINELQKNESEIDIIVVVNGEHNQLFNEEYRSNLLTFLANRPRVFPIFFPSFRGLAKLWNTIIIHANDDHILMLNDDIMIQSPSSTINKVRKAIRDKDGRSFTINSSWSHFVISREEIDALGYFDERLLGIGEEDGDITWRYFEQYGRSIADVKIRAFQNYAEETVYTFKPTNIQCHSGTKYSLFNKTFIDKKYQPNPAGFRGMFNQPVQLVAPDKNQYPNERFYRDNRKNI